MIKNDRQYRLTKAQVRSFADTISNIDRAPLPADVDPAITGIQKRALESQFDEMSHDLKEYEDLKAGNVTIFEAHSLAELPTLLVKARIARGQTQKQMAETLQVKEQQVQRWEANDFAGASIDTLRAVADALNVVITQQLVIPRKELTPKAFLASLANLGLGQEFVLNRVLPSQVASAFRDEAAGLKEVVSSASAVARVFGVQISELLGRAPAKFNVSAVAATRFKLPARAKRTVVDAYTLYAHYLSALLVSCVSTEANAELPTNYHDFHIGVTGHGQPMTLERALRFLSSFGVIVLPLRDAGGFHGAVWKMKGRYIVVLKQITQLESRWLYDALHEVGHIVNGDVTGDVALIEEQEISPESKGNVEEKANEWAEDVIFDGRSEEVEAACTKACGGRLQKLKGVLPAIAKDFNVNLGCLANHMAYRLAEQGENWWGAAKNVQAESRSPFGVARQILLENVDLGSLTAFDRELLQKAFVEQ